MVPSVRKAAVSDQVFRVEIAMDLQRPRSCLAGSPAIETTLHTTGCLPGELREMDARVKTVISMMERSLGDCISLRALANSVNLSPSRLRQLFTKETGQSPLQYLRDVRMRTAERLLTTTFLSIKEVAFVIGSRHVSSFVHSFKRRHGVTPGEFRARNAPAVRRLSGE
jgi:transcriptional regulator GlxA family with amidase domain